MDWRDQIWLFTPLFLPVAALLSLVWGVFDPGWSGRLLPATLCLIVVVTLQLVTYRIGAVIAGMGEGSVTAARKDVAFVRILRTSLLFFVVSLGVASLGQFARSHAFSGGASLTIENSG